MLKKDIGINAGTIWHLLAEKKGLSIREIGELTNHKEGTIILSLGWLARENKIKFTEKRDGLFVELNHSSSEMYY